MLFKISLTKTCVFVGEHCKVTCRDAGSSVVLLPRNLTVDALVKDHWRNPPKVKVQFLTITNKRGIRWLGSMFA